MITRTITAHRTEVVTTGEPIVVGKKLSLREIKKLCREMTLSDE